MIKQLRHGDSIPTSNPGRYSTAHGYIKLRWYIGDGVSVESYEHRVVCGLPDGHVHHINHDKADNRPENLLVVSPRKHRQFHQTFDRVAAARMYQSGVSTTEVGRMFGVSAGQISRALRSIGVVMRSCSIPKTAVDCVVVSSLHARGWRPRRIAEHIGVSEDVIRRAFRDLRLPSFRSGAPSKEEAHRL